MTLPALRRLVPGLLVVLVGVVAAFALGELVDVSPLVGGVVLGVIVANAGLIRPVPRPGHHLRRRSACCAPASSCSACGCRSTRSRTSASSAFVAVVGVVVATFFGVQLLAR